MHVAADPRKLPLHLLYPPKWRTEGGELRVVYPPKRRTEGEIVCSPSAEAAHRVGSVVYWNIVEWQATAIAHAVRHGRATLRPLFSRRAERGEIVCSLFAEAADRVGGICRVSADCRMAGNSCSPCREAWAGVGTARATALQIPRNAPLAPLFPRYHVRARSIDSALARTGGGIKCRFQSAI
jgi:hypothetical protein